MINIRSILKLAENDGLTLRAGKKITYKTGYQVATEGVECATARSYERCKALRRRLWAVVFRRHLLCR